MATSFKQRNKENRNNIINGQVSLEDLLFNPEENKKIDNYIDPDLKRNKLTRKELLKQLSEPDGPDFN